MYSLISVTGIVTIFYFEFLIYICHNIIPILWVFFDSRYLQFEDVEMKKFCEKGFFFHGQPLILEFQTKCK